MSSTSFLFLSALIITALIAWVIQDQISPLYSKPNHVKMGQITTNRNTTASYAPEVYTTRLAALRFLDDLTDIQQRGIRTSLKNFVTLNKGLDKEMNLIYFVKKKQNTKDRD